MKKKVLSTVTLYSQRCKSAKELLEKEGFEVIEYQGDMRSKLLVRISAALLSAVTNGMKKFFRLALI